jgi:hypothetical protein
MTDAEYMTITSNIYGVGGVARLLQLLRSVESIANGVDNPKGVAQEILTKVRTRE